MQNNQEQYFEIDLMRLLQALWHKAWIIALTAVVFAAAAFGFTYFMVTPMYQAECMLYINNNKDTSSQSENISEADITASQSLVGTYIAILNSRSVLSETLIQAGSDYTEGELSSMISASAVNETEVLRITITCADPQDASDLANAVSEVSANTMMETVSGCNVRIVDYATVPSAPSSPNIMRNTALGFLLGVILSAAVIILLDLTNRVIRSEKDLNTLFDEIPVLGVIPELSAKTAGSYGKYGYVSSDMRSNPADRGKERS